MVAVVGLATDPLNRFDGSPDTETTRERTFHPRTTAPFVEPSTPVVSPPSRGVSGATTDSTTRVSEETATGTVLVSET